MIAEMIDTTTDHITAGMMMREFVPK